MNSTLIKIENKNYILIREEDYKALINDMKDLKKVLSRKSETGMEANAFFKLADEKILSQQS